MEENLRDNSCYKIKIRGFKSFQMSQYRDVTMVNPKYFNRSFRLNTAKIEQLLNTVKDTDETTQVALQFIEERLETSEGVIPRYSITPNYVLTDSAHLYEELGMMSYSRGTQLLYTTYDNVIELFSLFSTQKIENLREIICERINDLDYEEYYFIPQSNALQFISRSILGDFNLSYNEIPINNYLKELFMGISSEFDHHIETMLNLYKKGSLFVHGCQIQSIPSQYDLESVFIYITLNDMQTLIHAQIFKIFEHLTDSFVITSKASGVTVVQVLEGNLREYPQFRIQGYCDSSYVDVCPKISSGSEVLEDYLDYYKIVYKDLGTLRDINSVNSKYCW